LLLAYWCDVCHPFPLSLLLLQYYYYHTQDQSNYYQTLTDVHQYATQARIPYRYVLLDSWWYAIKNVGTQ
jgi:hypothetical protein